MTAVLVLVCLYMFGSVTDKWAPVVLEVIKVVSLPFIVAWHVLEGGWNGLKWARSKVKLWRREPAYGDADFSTLTELGSAGCLDGRGFPVGVLGKTLVHTHHEAHLLMVGITGAGKSLTQGATFHHAKGETIISFDPKGNHRRNFEGLLRSKGYQTFHINLDDPLNGARYDPFAFFQNSGVYDHDTDYDTLARLVVGDYEDGKEDAGQHFSDLAFSMIAGVIADLVVEEPENATLEQVGQIWTVWSPQRRQAYFDRMMARAGNPTTRLAYNAFTGAGDREKGSIITTLSRKLKPWVTKRYLDICTPNGKPWTWEQMLNGPEPVCLFVTGGVGRRDELAPFLRVFFGQAGASIARHYNHTGKPLLRPAKLLIDEADLIAGCKPIVDCVTQLRSAHVNVFLVFQSVNQVRKNFRNIADTLISNCDLIVSGALKTPREYQDISQLIGNRTINPMSRRGSDVTYGESARKLMDEAAMFRLGRREHLCLLGNQIVVLGKPFTIRGQTVQY